MALEKVFGINPIFEILKSHPQKIHQLFLPTGDLKGRKKELYALAQQQGIKIKLIPRQKFAQLVGKEAHQGVVGLISPYVYQPLEFLLKTWRQSNEKALFLVLDSIEDPRNFGALVRTANTVGAHGIIVPKHRSAPVNMVAAKTAAGALNYTPVCRVSNLVYALENLKKEGIWIVGTADAAEQSLFKLDGSLNMAVVIGSEGKGIHSLVKKHCDFIVSIPNRGQISSLNASVAGALVLYEIIRQRHFA